MDILLNKSVFIQDHLCFIEAYQNNCAMKYEILIFKKMWALFLKSTKYCWKPTSFQVYKPFKYQAFSE